MRIGHLTFGQLYKLHNQCTLMRVTAAYHGALERAHNERERDRTQYYDETDQWSEGPDDVQSFEAAGGVAVAKEMFPGVAAPWEKLIAFLVGPELRAALRKAAGEAPARIVTGMWSDLTFCHTRDVGGAPAAHCRALAIRYFSQRLGIPAIITSGGDGLDEHFCVRVETDSMGAAVIRHHPGIPWDELREYCAAVCWPGEPEYTFWWVPEDFSGLVNPCLKPIRTPDEGKQIREILSVFGPSENVSPSRP
jgi:hypothetical protein